VHGEAVNKARAFLSRTQRDDGGWGAPGPVPLDTAISTWSLQSGADVPHARVEAGCDWLLQIQNPDGSWFSSPWIQMPIGRATGTVWRLATYESITMTTAFCLRSLVAIRARDLGRQELA
jgi:squalene cyclase